MRDEGAAPGQEKWKLVKKYVRCAGQRAGCAAWGCCAISLRSRQTGADVAAVLRCWCCIQCLPANKPHSLSAFTSVVRPWLASVKTIQSSGRLRSMRCHCRELLGPVTAIAALEGLLVVAAGKSVEVHEWVSTSLSHNYVKAHA